jgi:hypothetical protein
MVRQRQTTPENGSGWYKGGENFDANFQNFQKVEKCWKSSKWRTKLKKFEKIL